MKKTLRPDEVAVACGVSKRTVYRWIGRLRRAGLGGGLVVDGWGVRVPVEMVDAWRLTAGRGGRKTMNFNENVR